MTGANAYLVARHGVHVYVRAQGLASMRNAQILDAFLRGELESGADLVCVDLSACTGMDSTFMGLLVGIAGGMAAGGGKLVIINPTEAGLRLLTMLGVTEVVPVVDGCVLPDLAFVELLEGGRGAGSVARMDMVRRAHVSLVAINEANKAKFAAFLAALEADLSRQQRPE